MTTNRLRTTLALAIAIAAVLILFVRLLVVQWPRWRDATVYTALSQSLPPSFWWPPGWRKEMEQCILLAGNVRDPQEGTLELASLEGGSVYQTAVSRGVYTFHPRILPAGRYKVRLIRTDGTSTEWLPIGPLDPGSHRLRFAFQ
jgi:hypothetical protein